MSMAKKCDICGKFYEGYPGISGISFERMFMKSSDVQSTAETFDCCPECMDAIKKHLDSLKRGMNNERQ